MKGRRSSLIVGSFVLAGLALGIVAILTLGSGRLFRERIRYVVFFSGAVSGLQEGAPVTFRGVKVGTVTDIAVAVGGDEQVRIPVYIELEPDSIRRKGSMEWAADMHRRIDELVEQGLRAQLQLQSLLTGQLMVQLDLFPEEPPRLVGGDLSVPELPTKQSGLERLTRSVEELKLDEIAARMLNALEGIDRIVNSRQVQDGLADSAAILRDLREVVAELKTRAGPVSAQIGETSASLRTLIEQLNLRIDPLLTKLEATTTETQQLMANINASVDRLTPKVEEGVDATARFLEHTGRQLDLTEGPAADLVRNLTQASAAAERTLQQTQQTLARFDTVAGPGSPLETEATALITEVREAARSLRVLNEYLQRHPEALLRGKGRSGKDD